MESVTFKESLEMWSEMKKQIEQDGILAYLQNSIKIRLCPKCKGKLRINTINFKVYCSDCGYIEPCHLRHLTINQTNCSGCPYSSRFNKDLALKEVRKKCFAKRKNQYDKLALGLVERLVQENLDYPSLKWKCYQAWNPQATKKPITEIE